MKIKDRPDTVKTKPATMAPNAKVMKAVEGVTKGRFWLCCCCQ